MARDELSEAELETRLEAALAVAAVMGLQVLIGIVSRKQGWSPWGLPWWVWLALVGPELVLLVLLTWSRPRQRLVETGRRRAVSLGLVACMGLRSSSSPMDDAGRARRGLVPAPRRLPLRLVHQLDGLQPH